jgi:ParB family chromosome partitioning protein
LEPGTSFGETIMSFDTNTDYQSLDAVTLAVTAQPPGRDVAIPLSCLFLSPNNVRKVRHADDLPELAALIASQGLLHRLSVTDAGEGRYAVEAGGRRLAACQLLQAQGVYSADQPIDCRLYEAERAIEISTAENSAIAMHPADQFEAFAKLLASGLTEQQVASRFGVSVLTVQRRMTLASLAPRFIALFREGKVSMDQLQALALSPDHDLQIAAWDSLSEYQRSPYMIREALTSDEVEGGSRMARFVGLDAYVTAGGAVRRDLFGGPDEYWLQDGALVHRLAMERLETAAAVEREAGWSWVETHGTVDYAAMGKFERQWPKARKTTPEEAETLAFWQELVDEANAEVRSLSRTREDKEEGSDKEAAMTDQLDAADEVVENLNEIHDLLRESLIEWSPTQRETCGVIVTVDHQGAIDIRRGLMRSQDRKALAERLKKAGQPVTDDLQSAKDTGSPAKGERPVHSERLMLDLTAHRTAALQAALTDNTHVALALVVHKLVEPIFGGHRYRTDSGPLKIITSLTRHTPLSSRATGYAQSRAATVLERVESAWGEHLPGEGLFQWLLAQDEATLLELLAFAAASALDDMQAREGAERGQADALAEELDVHVADWWQATPETYFNSVSKAQLIDTVTEACGAEAAQPMTAQKKAESVAYAAAKLEGTRWLPTPLRRKLTAQ